MPKFDFQSQFSTSKIIPIFLIFLSLKNTNLGVYFLLLTFFDNINFLFKLSSKMMPNFWQLPITPILKTWQFHLNSWFLAKNLSNFVSIPWKLHNRYCHNGRKFTLFNMQPWYVIEGLWIFWCHLLSKLKWFIMMKGLCTLNNPSFPNRTTLFELWPCAKIQ